MRRFAQLRFERGQVAPARHLAPRVINHAKIHFQMRGYAGAIPHAGRHRLTGTLTHKVRQRFHKRAAVIGAAQESCHLLRQWEQVTPQPLGQRLEIGRHFVAHHARHQPVKRGIAQCIQQMQRHGHGDAIQRMTWFKTVMQFPVVAFTAAQGFGELFFGNVVRGMAHQILAREMQHARIFRFGCLTPRFKARAVDDAHRQDFVIEREQRCIIHQHIVLARLMLQALHIFYKLLILLEKFAAREELTRHQRAANKNLTRFLGVDHAIVHRAFGDYRQAIQGDALIGGDHRAILLPVRVEVVTVYQRACQRLYPFRIDFRHTARIQARGVREFRRHHPPWLRLAQGRAGEDGELDTARTKVFALVVLETDIAEQAREQRLVYLLRLGRRFILPQFQFARQCQQLAVDITPLAQPPLRQKVFVQ